MHCPQDERVFHSSAQEPAHFPFLHTSLPIGFQTTRATRGSLFRALSCIHDSALHTTILSTELSASLGLRKLFLTELMGLSLPHCKPVEGRGHLLLISSDV